MHQIYGIVCITGTIDNDINLRVFIYGQGFRCTVHVFFIRHYSNSFLKKFLSLCNKALIAQCFVKYTLFYW